MRKINIPGFAFILILIIQLLTSCEQERRRNAKSKSGDEFSGIPTYVNSGLIRNAADPFVFHDDDGSYYLYHTGKGFTVYRSNDLIKWTNLGKSMPGNGYKWAEHSFWAPEVVKHAGKYYLHYTAQTSGGDKKIGLAFSDRPEGPFEDVSDRPLYETPPKGVIDSHIFFDEGNVFLYYSNAMSTNQVGDQRYSEIWVIELEPDLSSTTGEAIRLIKPEQEWEYSKEPGEYWNEGSVVFKKGDTYYLMYSANCFCRERYAVGYATSDDPKGPFTKYAHNPVLSYEPYPDKVSGPGHHGVIFSPDSTEMFVVYHSHMDLTKKGGDRMINIDRMGVRSDGTLYINGPTVTPQPYPSAGANVWRNISAQAKLNSSSTQPGHELAALTDGEFSMYEKFLKYEWVARNDQGAAITMDWDQANKIGEIWIYNSLDTARQVNSGRIVYKEGTEIQIDGFRTGPGQATIVSLDSAVRTSGFTLYLSGKGKELALSEIMVMGLD